MFRRTLGAALVLCVVGGFALAETFQGVITKIDGDTVTLRTRGKGKGEKGTTHTFKITKDTTITKAAGKKGSEATKVSASDLKIAVSVVNVPAKIEAKEDGGDATSITVGFGGGRPGKKGGKGGKKGKNKTDE
jgi:hypothetical protein